MDTTGQSEWALTFEDPNGGGQISGLRRHSGGAWFEATNDVNGTFARLGNGGTWGAVSDRRMKKDIVTVPNLLERALKLQPVTFRFKAEEGDTKPHLGFIAQEVQKVLPDLVTGDEARETLSLDYSTMSVVAVGAVKELNAKLESKGVEIAALKKQLAEEKQQQTARDQAMEARLVRLEQALAAAAPPAAAPRKKVAAR